MAVTSLVHTLLSADQSRCILANLSANGDILANKGGHATEEETFWGGVKTLAAKKWNAGNYDFTNFWVTADSSAKVLPTSGQ